MYTNGCIGTDEEGCSVGSGPVRTVPGTVLFVVTAAAGAAAGDHAPVGPGCGSASPTPSAW
jgi:hypothetical protein